MTKKVSDAETKKFYIRIVQCDHQEVTREGNPGDKWDRDDISHEHTIHGFELVKENECYDFVLSEKPIGMWCLVCVFYSTGDSFHREDNCLSLVSFVRDTEDANIIREAIEEDYYKHYKDQTHDYRPLQVLLPNANRIEQVYTGTWKGYFERFDSAEVRIIRECHRPTFVCH